MSKIETWFHRKVLLVDYINLIQKKKWIKNSTITMNSYRKQRIKKNLLT